MPSSISHLACAACGLNGNMQRTGLGSIVHYHYAPSCCIGRSIVVQHQSHVQLFYSTTRHNTTHGLVCYACCEQEFSQILNFPKVLFMRYAMECHTIRGHSQIAQSIASPGTGPIARALKSCIANCEDESPMTEWNCRRRGAGCCIPVRRRVQHGTVGVAKWGRTSTQRRPRLRSTVPSC